MPFKMSEFDRFPGHELEDEGTRKRGSINLIVEKHPGMCVEAGLDLK